LESIMAMNGACLIIYLLKVILNENILCKLS
jgi:hypothetical protein